MDVVQGQVVCTTVPHRDQGTPQEINIGSTVDQMMSGRRHCLYNSLYNSLYKSAEKIQYLYGHILTKCGFFSFYIKLLNQHRDLKGTY